MGLSRAADTAQNEVKSIWRDILNGYYCTSIEKETTLNGVIDLRTFSANFLFAELEEHIRLLQQQDFDSIYTFQNGGQMLIKDLRGKSDAELNPIHCFEAEIQAVRYLRGMMLIANNMNPRLITFFTSRTINRVEAYNDALKDNVAPATATKFLANEFAHIIKDTLHLADDKHAHTQLTMARDIANLLEIHLPICTLTRHGHITSVSTSRLVELEPTLYSQEMTDLENKIWFQEACRIAGLNAQHQDNWLRNTLAANIYDLAARGTPALPSARWLPLPANVMNETITTIDTKACAVVAESQFYRLGVVVPYEVRHSAERRRLAKVILKSLAMQLLEKQILAYKKQYKTIIDPSNFSFYVNYQTLLTPQRLESFLTHKENSAEFIKTIKGAFIELEHDPDILAIAKKHGAKLRFVHTNSAINKHADWTTVKKFEDDLIVYEFFKKANLWKLFNFNKKHSDEINDPQLRQGIEQRLQAFYYFKAAIKQAWPYESLKMHQLNTMIAALECIMMQGPSLTFVGCKSSRDRTAVFRTALRTMQENPKAMYDWAELERGIIHAMEEGHVFRSMSHHSAIVKLKAVRKEYYSKLTPALQHNITLMKPFSKRLDDNENTPQRTNSASASVKTTLAAPK